VYLPSISADPADSFHLLDEVHLSGGYPGVGEPDPDLRDPELHPTTLSGDIGIAGDSSDNSLHVVQSSGNSASAILEGFHLVKGNDRGIGVAGYGGAILLQRSNACVRDCTFTENTAERGVCIYNQNSSPTISDCRFIGNSGGNAGGIFVEGGDPLVERGLFLGNIAFCAAGAVEVNGGFATLRSCRFLGGSGYESGGIYVIDGDVVVEDSEFSGNIGFDGGAMFVGTSCSATLVNCSIGGNLAVDDGGGIYESPGFGTALTMRNCVLWGSTPDSINGNANVTYSTVEGGWPGVGNSSSDPLFVDLDGADDVAGTEDDDLSLQAGSPAIDSGDPADAPPGKDLSGGPRYLDGDLDRVQRIDQGAREFKHAHLVVTGTPSPGQSLTLEVSGTTGLQAFLWVGTVPGQASFPPYGTLFFDLTTPWFLFFWGSIPSCTTVPVPANVPLGASVVLQILGLQSSPPGAGNLSVPTSITFQ
jgi:hypothetical protein